MTQNKTYDAIIVGGGLSGLTLSCLLGQRGLKVTCIDVDDPKKKPQDPRTTVISYGSQQVLRRAGAWEKLGTCGEIDHIEILDGSSPVLLEFMSREAEGKVFGWNIDNHDLKIALMARMKEIGGNIEHIAPAKVADFQTHDDHVDVHLADGSALQTRLVVGADGRGSFTRNWMAQHLGLQTRGWSYHQRAVICNITHEHPHNNVAIEHFWPQGPFAVLPMADDEEGRPCSSIVFTEHGPEKNSLMRLSDEDFLLALAARIPERYGNIDVSVRRRAFPLTLVHAAEYIGPRMVLVADAAHGIHPIAGQGLNLGFRDLDALDLLIGAAQDTGEDIGSSALLERYQQKRRPDNMAMIAVTDGLTRLFSNNIPPVRFLRKAGLKMVAKLPPAKRFFMKQAMGDR